MADPYLIQGPALISFSGGRTSAFMLHEILHAHDGQLPGDVVVAFANTGKEREETLRFVHECSVRWDVKVHWIEWRDDDLGYEEVGFNSASRNGEPFSALNRKRGIVPNQGARFCSVTLKTRTVRNFCVDAFGWGHWTNIIGLRYDEGLRVMKALARNDANKDRFKAAMPMAKAKHTKRGHVWPFWLGENIDPTDLTHPLPQGFDLGLRDDEGNCDLCFLKARAKLERIIREQPDRADWWIDEELRAAETASEISGAQFRLGQPYDAIRQHVLSSPPLPGVFDDDDHDAECGLLCGEAA